MSHPAATVVRSPTTIIAGVVALVFLVVGSIVALAVLGDELSADAKLVIIGQLMTSLGTIVPAMFALFRVNAVHHDLQNGLIPAKVQEGIAEMAADPDQPAVTFTPNPTPTNPDTLPLSDEELARNVGITVEQLRARRKLYE